MLTISSWFIKACVDWMLQFLGMLRLSACPSSELVEHQVLECHGLHHGLNQPPAPFAVNWSGSTRSSCILEGWDRGIQRQLGAFTSKHPKYFCSHSQMRVCSYAPKVMHWNQWKRWDHKSGVPSSNSSRAHSMHSQDETDRKRRGRGESFLSPFSIGSSVLLENSAWQTHAVTWLALFTHQLEGNTSFRGQNSKVMLQFLAHVSWDVQIASSSLWTSFPFYVSLFSNY